MSEFGMEIIAKSLEKEKFFLKIKDVFPVSLLKDEKLEMLWEDIVSFHKVHNKIPTFGVLSLPYQQDKEIKKTISEIKDLVKQNSIDEEILLETLSTYIKYEKFVNMYDEVGKLWNKGQRENAFDLFLKFESTSNIFVQNNDVTRIFKDFNKRNLSRLIKTDRERIATHIDELDAVLNGGMETGEYCLFLADSGKGKSFLAIHLAIAAARQGYKVFHAQLEGTKEQVESRYDSNWSATPYFQMKKGEIESGKLEKLKKLQSSIKGEVFVKSYEQFDDCTFDDILATFKNLKTQNNADNEPWVVVIDYLDLIQIKGLKSSSSEERFRTSKISKLHKNLAVSENCLVFGFTQASSIDDALTEDPDFVITRRYLSEDKGKVRPVDYLITLNQTRDEKKAKTLRLYIDKAREHEGGNTIYIKTNLKHSRFYSKVNTLKEFYS